MPGFLRECARLPRAAISSPSTCASRLRASSPATKQRERNFTNGSWEYPAPSFPTPRKKLPTRQSSHRRLFSNLLKNQIPLTPLFQRTNLTAVNL